MGSSSSRVTISRGQMQVQSLMFDCCGHVKSNRVLPAVATACYDKIVMLGINQQQVANLQCSELSK